MEPFALAVESSGPRALVRVVGELDTETAPQLRTCLAQLLGEGLRDQVIDLSGTRFIDSAGFNCLVESRKAACHEGGDLHLRSPRPAPRRAMEIVGLLDVIPVS